MTDIALLPARRLAAMIRQRKIGCLELLDHYLSRVETFNPALNAIIATDIPGARKRARAADRAVAQKKKLGAFHGVPMTVKEAFDIAGYRTTWGVPKYKDYIAKKNSLAVERWLEAGAVIFGKTNVPMWLADSQSFNAIHGATKNPWDPARTPGGSSGGSSAALAAGMTGIEIGSDIASSIRNPANYCGLYGHKPTFGICPPHGHSPAGRAAADDIQVIGPLARSAGDLEPALDVMAGPDEIDARGLRLALPAPRQKSFKDFRVALMLNDKTSEVDRSIQDSLQTLADFLGRKRAKVDDKARPKIDTGRAHRLFNLLLRAATSHRQIDDEFAANRAAAAALAPDDDSHPSRMLRAVTIAHRDWLALHDERERMRWAWHEFFKDYDVLICPSVPAPAYPNVHDVPSYQRTQTINGKVMPFFTTLFWAGFTGLAYLPSTAFPTGFSAQGLPLGAQIVGPQYGDRTTIHLAHMLEQDFQGFVPPPGYA